METQGKVSKTELQPTVNQWGPFGFTTYDIGCADDQSAFNCSMGNYYRYNIMEHKHNNN